MAHVKQKKGLLLYSFLCLEVSCMSMQSTCCQKSHLSHRSYLHINKLQEDLCALQEWQERWLMRLNVSKCFTMNVLHPRRNKIITHYKLHNHLLSPVEHYKYLGIIIQNDLKWHLHIQSITSKANQMLGLLKRNLRTPFMHLREGLS